jgi:F0F1-type ATP synthase assembly protein I
MDPKPPEQNLLRYATVGIEFLLVFLLFLFLGWQLDRYLVWSSPAFTVLGGITGFAAAFYRLAKQGWGILKSGRPQQKDRDVGPDDQG